jgi:hypothetical protein
MEGNTIAASYISIVNIPLGVPCAKGKVHVELAYQLFSGPVDRDTMAQFPHNEGKAPPGLPSSLGYDEYIHKPWTDREPKKSKAKQLAEGTIEATFTWNDPSLSFDCPNSGIGAGPQRLGRKSFFPPWIYDKTQQKWVRLTK